MIVVYGGSFNPITLAHEKIIKEMSKLNYINRVLIVPVGDKYKKVGLINSKDRAEMIKLSIKNIKKASIDYTEILSNKVLTTYETLNIIQSKYPNKKIYFILGADNLVEFSSWDNSLDILQEFGLMVIKRDSFDVNSIIENNPVLFKNKSNITIENIQTPLNISSSNVRSHFSDTERINLDAHLNIEVLDYINSNNLYR